MALRQIRIGSLPGFQYDDADYDSAAETDQPMKAGPPVDLDDVLRLGDLPIFPVASANIDNPTELNTVAGNEGDIALVYSSVPATGLNEYTFYAYDASGPAVSAPYVIDAFGAGSERWIAVAGKYRTSTIMNTLATKNPPIDADKVIYRDSTASDVLVTSTWTQIKAFLKTYFDTLYGTLGSAHARAHTINSATDHTDTSLAGISNDDLMQWDDPSSKWEPKSVAEVISGQSIAPGTTTITKLILATATELTISGGVVTATQSRHTIDTEGDIASDDLDTINGGTAGQILIISAANDARTVVCKMSASLLLQADFDLDSLEDTLTLECKSASVWREIARASNG